MKTKPIHSMQITQSKLYRSAALTIVLAAATLSAEAGQGPMPSICNRACWGARAPSCQPGNINALNRAIVHHTAGTGDWTTGYEDGKAKVRAIQNGHIDVRGFCDIAYAFLVNAGGHIYEGRNNALFGLPKGYHDCCNTDSFGFNVMGYYHPPYNQTFTTASKNSLMDVIAWRMPSSWSPYGSATYCGRTVGWLDGHNAVVASCGPTACPGDGIIPQLGSIRDGVNARKNGSNGNPPYYFNSGLDGWTPANSMGPLTWTDCCGFPGIIYGDQTGPDAYIHGPACNFVGAADTTVNVQVLPQNGTTPGHGIQLHWKTTAENFWDANKKSQEVGYVMQNNWIRLNLDITSAKWTGQTINQLRLDFDASNQGTRWLVNHIYPQVTPRWWFTSNVEGWTVGSGLGAMGWSNTGWPSIIYADQTGADAYFFSPTFSFLGGANDVILVRVYPQNGNTANHQMKVYFTTVTDGTWGESKSSITVPFTAQNTWTTVKIPVGKNPYWSVDFVNRIRLDVDEVNTATRWHIDYVAISAEASQQ